MFTFNEDFTIVTDNKGSEFNLDANAMFWLNENGTLEFLAIGEPEAVAVLKSVYPTKFDVDGGDIVSHSCSTSGLTIITFNDCNGKDDETVHHEFFPFAMHRTTGAFALHIYGLQDDGGYDDLLMQDRQHATD